MEGRRKKVLVIEDERAMAKALELKLTHEGLECKTAIDGAAGLAMLGTEAFDLILCDLVMPKMDGFHVLEEMKVKQISTPVIVLSNLSQTEDAQKAIALGAEDFFIKSDTPIAQIVERVKAILQ